jgi:hypothetical protein
MSDQYESWWDYYDNGPGSERMKREYLRERADYLKDRPVAIYFRSGSEQANLLDDTTPTDFKTLYEEQEGFIKAMLDALGISQGLVLDKPMLLSKLRKMNRQSHCWCDHVRENGDLREWEFSGKPSEPLEK